MIFLTKFFHRNWLPTSSLIFSTGLLLVKRYLNITIELTSFVTSLPVWKCDNKSVLWKKTQLQTLWTSFPLKIVQKRYLICRDHFSDQWLFGKNNDRFSAFSGFWRFLTLVRLTPLARHKKIWSFFEKYLKNSPWKYESNGGLPIVVAPL